MTPRQIAGYIVGNVLDAYDETKHMTELLPGGITLTDRLTGEEYVTTPSERSMKLEDAVLEALDELRLKFTTGPLDRGEDVPRGPGKPVAPPKRCDKLPDEELKASSLREYLEGKL